MTTTTIKTTSHRLGRAAANAYRHFNRFEAKTAGRFSFAGGLAVRAGFWMIRIAVVLAVAGFALFLFFPLLALTFFAGRMGEGPWMTQEEFEEDEKRRLARQKSLADEEENGWRWHDYMVNDGEPYGPYPRMGIDQ